MQNKRKFLSWILAVVMIISLIPTTALADEQGGTNDSKAVVAQDQDGNQYYTLADAIAGAASITLVADAKEDVVIPAGKDITLNLNGKTLTNVSGHTITNNGTLTIEGDGTVDNVTHARGALYNNAGATATLNGGTYTRSKENGISSTNNGGNSWYNIKNFGTMTINAGVEVKQEGQYSSLVANGWQNYTAAQKGTNSEPAPTEEAVLTINGGTFSGGINTVKNDDYAELTINDGSFTNTKGPAVLNWNVAEINGGTFVVSSQSSSVIANGYADNSYDKGQLTISGGTFTAANDGTGALFGYGSGALEGGSVTISGGTFNGSVATTNYPYTPVVYGGTFSSDVRDYLADGMTAETDEDGKYIVSVDSTKAVAQVGEENFLTVQAAVDSISGTGMVTLKQDATEDVTIPQGKTITLELDGKTLTTVTASGLDVIGELTVQDTAGGGKIYNDSITRETNALAVVSGKLTLKSGTIDAPKSFGVYVLEGGTAVVNGGTITSGYACLTGNNTTGDMNFEVTGGTLTSSQSEAIYMPGQVSLVVSGGTINGGISTRMGQITVTGGTINGMTADTDAISEYYDYSGSIWIGDAIYVLAGTYKSNNAEYANTSNIKISGGTINGKSHHGVAVYQIGTNYEQKVDVTVTGGTISGDAGAVSVISEGFEHTGSCNAGNHATADPTKVTAEVAISGGTFSTAVDEKYCAEGFQPVDNGDGTFGVESTAPVTYTITTSVTNGYITPEGEAAVEAGLDMIVNYAPIEGYELDSVTVDGEVVDAPESYTFTNVTANHTIAVVYKAAAVVPETVRVTFQVTPADAVIQVTDHDGIPIPANEDGSYNLFPGRTYYYAATADGYKPTGAPFTPSTAAGGNVVTVELEAITINIIGPNDEMTYAITLDEEGKVTAVQMAQEIDGAFSVPENTTLPYWTYKGWTFTAEKDGTTETFGTAQTLTQALADWLTEKISDGGWTLTMDSKTPGVYTPSGTGSSGGGGGSSSSTTTKTETVTNSDGSTTTTVTNTKTGTVTETVKTAEGVTGTTVTDKNGDVTKVTASVPADVAKDAAASGEAVTLPVEVPAVKDTDDAPAVSVTVPKSAGAVKVEIPVEKVTSGTVAVIVNADGTEEIVKTSVPTEDGVALTVEGSATVKVIDNSKEFVDVHPVDHWAEESIDFVTSRELFNGKTADTFAPNDSTTRAQLMTVLARLDGADTTGAALERGMAWAVEKGVSDGTNPSGTITRQQLAAMLYRYADSPVTDYELTHSDAHRVSDYAVDAMRWAVANGIITGKADGTLDPHGLATRAQVATMMARYCAKIG